jgi:hypothetical protein
MVLKFLKSEYTDHDATNVVGYYSDAITDRRELPADLSKRGLPEGFFTGNLVVDPAVALALVRRPPEEVHRTLWVFRYYDLQRNHARGRESRPGLLTEFPGGMMPLDAAPSPTPAAALWGRWRGRRGSR